MENRKQHLLIYKIFLHIQTGHVPISQRSSIFGQSVSWITNFSHIFQYLQCLYHVSSYAKAPPGEFNC